MAVVMRARARPVKSPRAGSGATILCGVRVGKGALHALLLEWLERLTDGGRAYLVVQRHLGSDSLARWLEEKGYAVRRLASKRGYRVLEVSGSAS